MHELFAESSLTWIADSTPDYIIIIDTEYKVIYVNRVLDGLTREQVINTPLYLLVKPEDQLRVKAVFEEIAEYKLIKTYETDYQKPDGSYQYFESLAKPLILENQFKGISISSRDITEKKTNELKYNHLLENFLNQKESLINILEQRYKDLSQFALTVNHDVKNFLDSISLFASLELEKGSNENMEKIITASNSIKELLENSLSFSREGLVINSKVTEIFLGDFLRNLATIIIPKTELKINEKLPKIKADQVKITQIFKNIFENAVKHGKASKISINSEMMDNNCILTIKNNGKIIPEKLRDQLFNGDIDITKTHGNGLKIVKKLINAHKWSINLNPSKNETIFEITIPSSFISQK